MSNSNTNKTSWKKARVHNTVRSQLLQEWARAGSTAREPGFLDPHHPATAGSEQAWRGGRWQAQASYRDGSPEVVSAKETHRLPPASQNWDCRCVLPHALSPFFILSGDQILHAWRTGHQRSHTPNPVFSPSTSFPSFLSCFPFPFLERRSHSIVQARLKLSCLRLLSVRITRASLRHTL